MYDFLEEKPVELVDYKKKNRTKVGEPPIFKYFTSALSFSLGKKIQIRKE